MCARCQKLELQVRRYREENRRIKRTVIYVANNQKTECKRGHPLSGDNLWIYHNPARGHAPERRCRACLRMWQRQTRERKKAKVRP